jgi:hypothetical protein
VSQRPAETFFQGLDATEQAKVLALFGLLAGTGRISNAEKFKAIFARDGSAVFGRLLQQGQDR